MSETEVNVLATLQALPGLESDVEEALCDAVRSTHSEPGCLRYSLQRHVGTTSTYVVVEKWISTEALDLHSKAPAFQKLMGALDGKLAGAPEVVILNHVDVSASTLGTL